MSVGERKPRASQRRRSLRDVSPEVHRWLTDRHGEFRIIAEYTGGLSVGCASGIETSDGTKLFVKAVDVSPADPIADLLRHEAHVLGALPRSPRRPHAVGFYDDDTWVALVTAHMDGYYPDFADPEEFAVVAETIKAQSEELAPPPSGLRVPSLRNSSGWWEERWEFISAAPTEFLPEWAMCFADVGVEAARRTRERMPDETVCHFDVRNDNIFLTSDGTDAIVFDWGIAMSGPLWADRVMLALQLDDVAAADAHLRDWFDDDTQDAIDDFLVAFGGSQGWDARQPVPARQPGLRDYLREDSERILRLALHRKATPST